jgi:tetratricopeptide (TPR) repeat protein
MQAPGPPRIRAVLDEAVHELVSRDTELAERRAAAQNAPNDVNAELALLRTLRALGLLAEALNRLESREAAFASFPEWQAEYAVTLVLLGRRDEAIARYRRVLQLAPENPQIAVELAMLLLERRESDDLTQAWELSNRAMQAAPDAPNVLACRAELLALRGDLAQAVELYRRAIDRLPPDSPARHSFEERARTLGDHR